MGEIMSNEINKDQLICEILSLVATNNEQISFNPKYIEYFELDELIEIKDILINKKEQNKNPSKDYLDEIFNSCS